MSQKKDENKILLMAVAFDQTKNTYSVDLAKGSNVAETAFSMAVVIKCLIRDGIVKEAKDVTDLINKYLDDPQYNEVKKDEQN